MLSSEKKTGKTGNINPWWIKFSIGVKIIIFRCFEAMFTLSTARTDTYSSIQGI